MDFVSLYSVLGEVSQCFTAPRALTTEDAEAWRLSEAAKWLYSYLHNNQSHGVGWVEKDEVLGPLFKDAVANEGMQTLQHVAGWYGRKLHELARHAIDCARAGIDPELSPLGSDPRAGPWGYGERFMREAQIGFERPAFERMCQQATLEQAATQNSTGESVSSHLALSERQMSYRFPNGSERVSLWALACGISGQNPLDERPNADTVRHLQELCLANVSDKLFCEWSFRASPDAAPIFRLTPHEATAGAIWPVARRPEAISDWEATRRRLTLIDVRREDWERFACPPPSISVPAMGAVEDHIKSLARHQETKTPAPLRIGHPETRLTKWLAYETWTTEDAAMLVNGFDPASRRTGPLGAIVVGLCGEAFSEERNFGPVREVLERLKRRKDASDRVVPAEFVAWCEGQGIDTGWLRELRLQETTVLPPAVDAARQHQQVLGTVVTWSSLDKRGKTDLILSTLERLGYDRKALPVGLGKTAGAKAAAWAEVEGLGASRQAFDSFWKNMKADGHIADAKPL